MFYFLLKLIIDLLIIYFLYFYFNQKEITFLEELILLFIFNILICSFYLNLGILNDILFSLIIIVSYFLYCFLYKKFIIKKVSLTNQNSVLINRGIINFQELIKEHYSYESLLLNLQKRGIKNPSLVDYCIKNGNDLIVFSKNSVKNYPISLIIDGHILKDNLFSLNKSYEWLIEKISLTGLELKNINYAYFKNRKVYFITN